MKKDFAIIIGITLLVLFAYLTRNLLEGGGVPTPSAAHSEELTTQELKELLYQEKLARRKSGKKRPKFDNPDEFLNYHWEIRTRPSEDGPGYGPNHKIKALKKAQKNANFLLRRSARTQSASWQERGPSNVPGRTRGLLVMPDDPTGNTWIAGAVGGGIWKTSDGGSNWSNRTPELPSLAISWLAVCNSQPAIVYAATGETNGGGRGIIGSGVFKSANGGNTWIQLSSTADQRAFTFINRIIVDPDKPDKVLISTSEGEWEQTTRSEIYRSMDGGGSWEKVHASSRTIFQIIANPQNFNTIYGSLWGKGIIKSTDGGDTWSEIDQGFDNVIGRLELAVAPTDSSRLYASVLGNSGFSDPEAAASDLYVSYDAGESWTWVDQTYNSEKVDFLGGQGNYDNTIVVNPYNEDEVYYGGVSLWKTVASKSEVEEEVSSAELRARNGSFSQWDFINFGGPLASGKLETGPKLDPADLVDVEIRLGPGKVQRAYRFVVNKQGSGVPDDEYEYKDYIDVPFEVWDISSDRQLMVSFRDQQEDSVYNLIESNTTSGDEANHSREYIFIHDVEYSDQPNENIAVNGGANQGHTFKQLYFFWPVLQTGGTWDPEVVEVITIDHESKLLRKSDGALQPVSDAYGDYISNLNPAYGSGSEFNFHPDHHNLIAVPVDTASKTFRIVNANDGGVYVSNTSTEPGTDNGDWTSAGFGYNTGQFYSATKQPGADRYVGGLQDNGTWLSPPDVSPDASTAYEAVLGGDGFDVLWHATDPKKIMISIYNNRFYRSENSGVSWTRSDNGLGGDKPFFSKLASSKTRPDMIYTVGSLGVDWSDDFGKNWNLTPIKELWGFSNFMDIKVSEADPDIVWAGSGMSANLRVHVSTDEGKSFTPTSNYTLSELGTLSGMAAHPEEDSTAYVLFSFAGGPKILRTMDLGQSWEDISGFGNNTVSSNGFPDVAVYSLLVLTDESNTLWAGTEIGIFESMDDGQSWTFLESELGAAAVWDMQLVDDQVVAATHGRGIFSATINNAVVEIFPPVIKNTGVSFKQELLIESTLPSTYDSTVIFVDGISIGSYGPNEKGDLIIAISGTPVGDSISIELIGYSEETPYNSGEVQGFVFEVGPVVNSYQQDFDQQMDNFASSGFGIQTIEGFDNGALHSLHPYPEGILYPGAVVNLVSQLKKPLIIAGDNPILTYRDIAIVEPGDPNYSFPSERFKDYVILEATQDGLNWVSLAKGYDATKSNAWKQAYESNIDPDQSLFLEHELNLKSLFQEGDTVFLRFRLYSNEATTGWGWVIDDLLIQDRITSIEDEVLNAFLDVKVYPNPTAGDITVSLNLNSTDVAAASLMDINGKVVWQRQIFGDGTGTQLIPIDGSSFQKGLYLLQVQTETRSEIKKIIFR